jgi:hypothetical protein
MKKLIFLLPISRKVTQICCEDPKNVSEPGYLDEISTGLEAVDELQAVL